jgi:uncharacterized membrane protein
MFSLLLPPLLIPALFLALPFLPTDRFFSMQVPPDWRSGPEARYIRLGYIATVVLVAAISTALFLQTGTHPSLLYLAPLAEVAGLLAAWSWGWRRTLPHRIAVPVLRSASLGRNASFMPVIAWTLAALLPLLMVAVYLAANYSCIPQTFATHFDAHGSPNHLVTRSHVSVFGPLVIGAAAVLLLTVLLYVFSRRSAGIADNGQYALLARHIIAGAAWLLSLTFCVTGVLPLVSNPGRLAVSLASVSSGFLLLLLLASLGYFVRRQTTLATAQATTAEQHWRAGLWYYNPNDAALFVPKRIGFGYTLNMAHPSAWLIMVATLVVGLLPLVLKHL